MTSPPPPAAYTAAEVEVAAILAQLSGRHRRRRRRAPESLRWGARRRRSAGPPPPPRDELSHVGPAASSCSPETPLSFPASGESPPPPPPAFKSGRRYREVSRRSRRNFPFLWVEMQQEKVASLAQGRSCLLQQIEEFKDRLQQLQALNSFLKRQKSQLLDRKEGDKAPDGLDWAPAAVTAAASTRDFDLNKMPAEDGDVEEEAAVQAPREDEKARRAATSAEARRRRMERQREKAAAAAQRATYLAATSEMAAGGTPRVG